MRKITIMSVVALLVSQLIQAQGTITYLSNLGQTSTGSNPVGSDSWLAAGFQTGNNVGGYMLDSIQLGMTNASGNPSDFTVMLYKPAGGGPPIPGSRLITLNGSLDPETAGIYTYTPSSNFNLLPNYRYFIVVTAGTTVADGAYEWSYAGANSYNPSDGWSNQGGVWTSNDGSISSWNSIASFPQFAIEAIAVPEPSPSWMLLLGGGIFIYVRRAFRH
jgi:hypothetical protein